MRSALARLSLVALAAGAALTGCRSGSALHGRYNDFRAYYNTYYNASRSLEDGEQALQRSSAAVDRGRLVAVFPETQGAASTTGPFQDAIDKSADLLRERPDSKWADDALLVIGKAYFYQRNLAGAEQKFRETMAAAEIADDRRLGDEARFWLGRTYAAGDRYDDGVAVLEQGLADDAGDRRWAPRMRLALGELYARAGRWAEAAGALREGAPGEDDADVAGRAYLLLGQVEEHTGDWDAAADAYRQSAERRPAYDIAYAAQVGRALVLGLDAGRTDDALAEVRQMRADGKNYDRRAELALAEARLRAAAGDRDRALGLYRAVLYDDDLRAQGPVAGEAHYRLAEFYRDALGDYVRASAHFDTAATALRGPAADARAARGAIVGAGDQARTYAVVASAARRIAESDSLLALGDLDDDAFQARIGSIEADRRRVYVEEQRRLDAARTAAAFQEGGGVVFRGTDGAAPRTTAPGSNRPTGQAGGFLSYRDPASIQAGQIAFEQRWGTRPLVPNWRRRAAVLSGDVASAQGVQGDPTLVGLGTGDGPVPLDLSQVPRTPAKRLEMVTELAGLRYELANAFFLSLGRPDTAAVLYRTILSETPDAPVAVRARYALAEIERSAGRDDAARPLYQAVADADTAAIGRASRVRLGLEPSAAAGPVETSAAYDAARARWTDGDPLGGARDLVALGDADPDAEVAPRAYLAAAAAYVASVGADTLALAGPLPPALVSRVLLAAAAEVPAAPAGGAPPPAGDDREPDEGEQDEGDPAPRPLPRQSLPQQAAPQQAAPERPGALPVSVARPAAPRPGPGPSLSVRDVGFLAPADTASFTLRHHLAALALRYPGTPYAARALALAVTLPAPERPALEPPGTSPDSTSSPSPSPQTPPVVAESPAPSPAPAGAPSPDPGAPPSTSEGVRGEDPVDPARGGYTWRVQRVTLVEEALPLVDLLIDQGYRSAALQDEATGETLVAVGQFDTAEAAEAVRTELPAWAQVRAEVVPLAGLRVTEVAPATDGDL